MSMVLPFDADEFICAETLPASSPFVPEITLQLATEVTSLWQSTEQRLQRDQLPPPFWAFAWPGGLGIARYILDNPELVRGKRILDFAAGGGIGAIAAMKAGAASVLAVDIDPLALHAMRINANLNNVVLTVAHGIDMATPPKNFDLIIVGDVCYQQAMAAGIMRWLWLCVGAGQRVLLADPGRAYVPESGLTELASYTVPTLRDLESEDRRVVKVWDLGLPINV